MNEEIILEGKPHVTTKTAADMLGISRQAVHKKISAGHLSRVRIGKLFFIPLNDVTKVKANK